MKIVLLKHFSKEYKIYLPKRVFTFNISLKKYIFVDIFIIRVR